MTTSGRSATKLQLKTVSSFNLTQTPPQNNNATWNIVDDKKRQKSKHD